MTNPADAINIFIFIFLYIVNDPSTFHNTDFIAKVRQSADQPLELEVERNLKVLSMLVTPRISDSGKVSIGLPISRKVSSFSNTTVSSRFYDLPIFH